MTTVAAVTSLDGFHATSTAQRADELVRSLFDAVNADDPAHTDAILARSLLSYDATWSQATWSRCGRSSPEPRRAATLASRRPGTRSRPPPRTSSASAMTSSSSTGRSSTTAAFGRKYKRSDAAVVRPAPTNRLRSSGIFWQDALLILLGQSTWRVCEWGECVMLGGAGAAGDQSANSGQQLWRPAGHGRQKTLVA